MNDYANLEKTIVRELSCRLCLCTDVVKLKPLSAEVKRKIKRLFDIIVRADDNLPKAICHDCLQHITGLHLYTVKVERTQKFLEFHKLKTSEEKRNHLTPDPKKNPIIADLSPKSLIESSNISKSSSPSELLQQGDTKSSKINQISKKKNPTDLKFMEAMTLEEFAQSERLDKHWLSTTFTNKPLIKIKDKKEKHIKTLDKPEQEEISCSCLDPIVLIDGRPAKQGTELDKQITLFYKMECYICHENGFHFRSLMKHYKDRHGVPGYLTCCEKKFHYFYPKKIIEHMAFHLQQNIFMCLSCHQNFQTSQELIEHQSNGGRSNGKITCPRCSDRYPTYHELGCHIISHRNDKMQCDYCGKLLKHHHRKKTINHMEDVVLCSQCIRTLKSIEKQEKEIKEKLKSKHNDIVTYQKYQKFKQAMGFSGDEDGSTD